jgi:bifunctional non-homologous end joining protein LigD
MMPYDKFTRGILTLGMEASDCPINFGEIKKRFITPMAMTLVKKAFTHEDWHFEIKWDGFRTISFVNCGAVHLKSRNNKSLNTRFAAIKHELEQLNLHAVFDGEVVVLKEDGSADFSKLMSAVNDGLVYYVFDLLCYDGVNLMDRPLINRRELLEHILPPNSVIRFSDHIETEGEVV